MYATKKKASETCVSNAFFNALRFIFGQTSKKDPDQKLP